MTSARQGPIGDARERWIVVGIVVLAVIIPALIATDAGAILIPHNDDFSFRRVANTLYATGGIQFTGWSIMTLVGQLAFTMPFLIVLGGSAWAFAASTAVLSTLGIVASFDLARRVLPTSRATVAVLIAVLTPGFLRYTTTYMTDVPALAGEMLCLAIGAAALHRTDEQHRWRWLIASLTVGCWAFSIREFALAAPVAVVIAAFASDPGRRVGRYLVAGVAVIAVCAGIYVITQHLPGQGASSISPFAEKSVARVADAPATLAFILAPAVVLCFATCVQVLGRRSDRQHQSRRTRIAVGAAAGLTVAALLFRDNLADLRRQGLGTLNVMIGTVFGPHGTPDAVTLAGVAPVLYGQPLWGSINMVALLAEVVALALLGAVVAVKGKDVIRIVDPRRRPSSVGSVAGLLAVFAILYALGTVAFGLTVSIFDRYLWPLVLPLAVLLLWRPLEDIAATTAEPPAAQRRVPGPSAWLAGLILVGIGFLSFAMLLDSVAFDAARWRIGEEETARGIPAIWIDAGFEWVGYHSTDHADMHAPFPPFATRYTRLWPSYRQCVVVSSSRIEWPGLTLAETRQDAYRMLLVTGAAQPLYVYRSSDPPCHP